MADLSVPIDGDTRWRDLYDTLSRHEQDCIRDSLGAGLLQMVKGEPVSLNAYDWAQEWQVVVFNCLDAETGRAILLFDMVAGFWEDELPSVQEMNCMMQIAAETDPAAAVSSLLADSSDRIPMGEFWAGFIQCMPDRFIHMTFGYGDGSEFPDSETAECLHQAIATLDGESVASLLTNDTDAESIPEDPFFGPFMDCLSQLWPGSNGDPEVEIDDDHSDEPDGATSLNIGHSASGSIDYDSDHDLFALRTREGETYQLDVSPGTLEEPGLTVFNAEFQVLADNHDYEGSTLRVVWQSPVSGTFYIAVWGWDLGTYTLTAKVVNDADLGDDHSNTRGGAAVLTLDMAIPGMLEYESDVDIFRLGAQEGTIYEFQAAPGTLEYLELELRDARWDHLESGYYRNKPGGYVISWRAPESGEYFLVVRGLEEGSYTLSGTAIEDTHRDSSEEATPIKIGEVVEASIHGEDDPDYFVFQSNEGSIYRIVIELGTLKDTVLTLYDRRGEIATNDDYGESYASRILWEAPDSGMYWVSVSGYNSGTYTLVVERFTPGD